MFVSRGNRDNGFHDPGRERNALTIGANYGSYDYDDAFANDNDKSVAEVSEAGLVTAAGLSDVVVVSTGDAVLVASVDGESNIESLVERMKTDARCETQRNRGESRPWGHFETVDAGRRYQVKQIVVRPGGRLSLQLHRHRSEHWVVVSGTAHVVCGDTERYVCENESVYIPPGSPHRLENPGKIPLTVVEVQCGSYLGEDDIVRLEDVYGRS